MRDERAREREREEMKEGKEGGKEGGRWEGGERKKGYSTRYLGSGIIIK